MSVRPQFPGLTARQAGLAGTKQYRHQRRYENLLKVTGGINSFNVFGPQEQLGRSEPMGIESKGE